MREGVNDTCKERDKHYKRNGYAIKEIERLINEGRVMRDDFQMQV